jgi:hypothetical protein
VRARAPNRSAETLPEVPTAVESGYNDSKLAALGTYCLRTSRIRPLQTYWEICNAKQLDRRRPQWVKTLPPTFSNAAAELASTPDTKARKLLIFAVVYLRLIKWRTSTTGQCLDRSTPITGLMCITHRFRPCDGEWSPAPP